jgi:hypothetical protein
MPEHTSVTKWWIHNDLTADVALHHDPEFGETSSLVALGAFTSSSFAGYAIMCM